MNKNNEEDRFIDDESKKKFEEAKKGFAGFKEIDWILPGQVKIAEDALPKITTTEAQKRINDAMERLYGKEPDNQETEATDDNN